MYSMFMNSTNSQFTLSFIGHGFAVETHIGRVSVTNSAMSSNAGNGLKAKFLDGRFPILNSRQTFCELVLSTGAQRFPQLITGVPAELGSYCELVGRRNFESMF